MQDPNLTAQAATIWCTQSSGYRNCLGWPGLTDEVGQVTEGGSGHPSQGHTRRGTARLGLESFPPGSIGLVAKAEKFLQFLEF